MRTWHTLARARRPDRRCVYEAALDNCPVVLVTDTGGAASMIHHFLITHSNPTHEYYGHGEIRASFKIASDAVERRVRTQLKKIVEQHHNSKSKLITFFRSERDDDLERFLVDPFLQERQTVGRPVRNLLFDRQKLLLAVQCTSPASGLSHQPVASPTSP
jgi:hypothetical protein